MRDNWLLNRIFNSYGDLVDHCCAALGQLVDHGLLPGNGLLPERQCVCRELNAILRLECLGRHWFLDDARKKVEEWRTEYNRASQHTSVCVIEENRFC